MVDVLTSIGSLAVDPDEETTREQILPHLDSMQSQNEIRNYLEVRHDR